MMEIEASKVSVIIPLFNRRYLIEETLTSIITQTFPNWEVIVIDDGSSDGSYEFAKELAKADARIKVFRRTRLPKGAPTCRNMGVAYSRGEYLIFLDSDDLLAPYCLERRVKLMNENPELDFGVFHVLKFIKKPGDLKELWNYFSNEDDLSRFIKSSNPWMTASPIWRKAAIAKFGGWDESIVSWQDFEFHVRALAAGLTYKKMDDIPDCFIRRDESDRMSKEGKNLAHLLARKELFIKINHTLHKYNAPRINFNYLAGYFYSYAEFAILYKIAIDANQYYREVRKLNLIHPFLYTIASMFIWIRKHLSKRSYIAGRLVRRCATMILPRYVTQSYPRPGAYLEESKYDEMMAALYGPVEGKKYINLMK